MGEKQRDETSVDECFGLRPLSVTRSNADPTLTFVPRRAATRATHNERVLLFSHFAQVQNSQHRTFLPELSVWAGELSEQVVEVRGCIKPSRREGVRVGLRETELLVGARGLVSERVQIRRIETDDFAVE